MKNSRSKFDHYQVPVGLILCILLFYLGSISAHAQTASASGGSSDKIPRGTILPVVLRSAFSFDKAQAGQTLHGEIAARRSPGERR